MRVGVDRNKYQIHIPLPPKIDPTVTMMQVSILLLEPHYICQDPKRILVSCIVFYISCNLLLVHSYLEEK